MYFIVVTMFLLGFLSISLGQISSDNVKDISELLADDKNTTAITMADRNHKPVECGPRVKIIAKNCAMSTP